MKNYPIFGLLPSVFAAIILIAGSSAASPSVAQTTPPATTPPVTAPPTTPATADPTAAPKPSRRAMRMGTDPEAAKISTKPVPTTIEAVSKFVRPKVLSMDTRVKPAESTIWSIEGSLVAFQSKPDGDFYITIRDDAGNVMTAELPDPDLEKDCPWYKDIAVARKTFADASGNFRKTAVGEDKKPPRVRIVGAGFFGRPEAGENALVGLRNGFQIHPVTEFTLLP